MRHSTAAFALAACVAGCATESVSEYRAPNGVLVKTAKCASDRGKCFALAAKSCAPGGTYQVLSSESHAGGLGDDVIPGPVTWFSMSYACGPSDGALPGFPFGGPAPGMPNWQPSRVTTNCTTVGNATRCTTR